MTPPKPPTPDKPVLRRETPALDQQPERPDVRHSGVDGAPIPPLKRTGTMPNMAALKAPPIFESGSTSFPHPPALPTELARTQRAPSTTASTVRATPPTGIRIPAEETPSGGQPGGSAELARDMAELAEFRRRERIQVESRGPGPYQPPLRSPSPVPSSSPEGKLDRAIGGTVRLLLSRYGWPALAVLGIGGAALKPAADPAKQDAALVGQEELTRKVDRLGAKLDGVIDREATRDDFLICLYEQQADYFAQLLPSQERLVAAQPLRTWVDRCRNRKPRP